MGLLLFFGLSQNSFAQEDWDMGWNPNNLFPDLSNSEHYVDLPGTDWKGDTNTIEEDFLPTMMKTILSIVAITVMIVLLVSGIMMITSFGDSEQRTKAKHMIYWGILGIILIVLAYALVKGITQLQFNK